MTSRLRLRRCRVARALRRRTSGSGTFLTVSVAIVVYPNWYQNGSIERIPRAIGPRQSKGLRSRVLLPRAWPAQSSPGGGLGGGRRGPLRSRMGAKPPSDALALVRALVLGARSEEHTSELQSHSDLVCRLLLEKKKKNKTTE